MFTCLGWILNFAVIKRYKVTCKLRLKPLNANVILLLYVLIFVADGLAVLGVGKRL